MRQELKLHPLTEKEALRRIINWLKGSGTKSLDPVNYPSYGHELYVSAHKHQAQQQQELVICLFHETQDSNRLRLQLPQATSQQKAIHNGQNCRRDGAKHGHEYLGKNQVSEKVVERYAG